MSSSDSTAAPRLLALETSSATGSVALARGSEISERTIATPREQTDRLLPLVHELLAEAGLGLRDLDAIVFGRGPGSFTGLRIAAAMAQGLALAAGLPVAAVSSLQALAERAGREHAATRVLTCVDARMGEVYWALYERSGGGPAPMRLVGEERLAPPEAMEAALAELAPPLEAWYAAGDGWARYRAQLEPLLARAAGVGDALYPTARDLLPQAAADLGAGNLLAPEHALPVYLRSAAAWHK